MSDKASKTDEMRRQREEDYARRTGKPVPAPAPAPAPAAPPSLPKRKPGPPPLPARGARKEIVSNGAPAR